MANSGKAIHGITYLLLVLHIASAHARYVVSLPAFQGLLRTARQGYVVHLRVFTCVHLADGLLTPDVEEQDLLVCTYADCKRPIYGHLD